MLLREGSGPGRLIGFDGCLYGANGGHEGGSLVCHQDVLLGYDVKAP
jgi:hypothetical protein